MVWISVIGLIFLGIAEGTLHSMITPIWTYDDETTWPGILCREGGTRQSPIDIHTRKVKEDTNNDFIKNGELVLEGYRRVLMTGFNNGHTIQFSSDGEENMHPTLTGGPLKHSYRLEQLHFHWLSEHAINGIKYPMEIHMVHIRSDLTVAEALEQPDGLAIISVFCHVRALDLDNQLTDATDELMLVIPFLLETGSRHAGDLMDLTRLLPIDLDSYLTYAGSLTSPQCNEAVIWIIFDKPIVILDDLYQLFGKSVIGRHNYRSLQQVTNHTIYRPPGPPDVDTPYIVKLWFDMIKYIKDIFGKTTAFVG